MIRIIGPVTVPVPGTPVLSTAAIPSPQTPARYTCHAALFQARSLNTGKVYIGSATMVKATLAGVIAVLAIPSDSSIPSFSIALTLAPAGITLSDLYIDADVAGEGVLLSTLET